MHQTSANEIESASGRPWASGSSAAAASSPTTLVGSREHVPGVPALEAPEVDAHAAGGERSEGERPACDATQPVRDDRLDEVEGEEAKHEPDRGRADHEEVVEPVRAALVVPEPLEVGDDVRRVRQEEQPQGPRPPRAVPATIPAARRRRGRARARTGSTRGRGSRRDSSLRGSVCTRPAPRGRA